MVLAGFTESFSFSWHRIEHPLDAHCYEDLRGLPGSVSQEVAMNKSETVLCEQVRPERGLPCSVSVVIC